VWRLRRRHLPLQLRNPAGQHIAIVTVNYLLSPGSVTDRSAAKQAVLAHTVGELVLL